MCSRLRPGFDAGNVMGMHIRLESRVFVCNVVAIEPRLRGPQPGPTLELGGEIDLTPFDVIGRPLKFVDPRKEGINECIDPPIPF